MSSDVYDPTLHLNCPFNKNATSPKHFYCNMVGLVASRTASPYPDIINKVLPPVQQPIHQQQCLGWHQLYYGWVSKAWAQAINSVHPLLKHNGNQVLAYLQQAIWQYVLDTWTLCNQHLHHTNNQVNIPDFRQAACTLYEQQDRLNPAADNH